MESLGPYTLNTAVLGDCDSGEFNTGESKWEIVEIGLPDEEIIILEWTGGKQITAISTKRNVYRSSDQGITFEYIGQLSRLRYWGKRIKGKWQDLRVIVHWLVIRAQLYWLRKIT